MVLVSERKFNQVTAEFFVYSYFVVKSFLALFRFVAVEIVDINWLSALANLSHQIELGLLGRTHKFFGSGPTR